MMKKISVKQKFKINKMNYIEDNTLTEIAVKITNYLPDIGIEKVRKEILEGLKATKKYILPKYFYNEKGSEIFELITKLDEYYPTRTEKKILSNLHNNLNIDFSKLSIIELGSGDPSKIRLLLQQIPENKLPEINYYPVDISQSAIESSAEQLVNEFPMISINGIVADFMHQLNMIPKTEKRLFCFFGSTIGNLTTSETESFMKLLGAEMQDGDSLLLGMDMIKNIDVLENAYNDSQQITADFNRNILNVVNNLVGTDFNPEEFEHLAFYNKEKNRIEMHLKAKKDVSVTFNSGTEKIHIRKGENIHTENSHKFNKEDIKTLGDWAGLKISEILTDDNNWFSLVYFIKTP